MQTDLEHILTSFYKNGMISYMDTHPEDFEEAIQLAVSNKQPYSWRAAWLLCNCMNKNDTRLQRHTKNIIDALKDKKDGHQRELLILLLQMDLDEDYEGILFQLCVDIWVKINKSPSLRITAFRALIKIAKKYPELSNEIIFLSQNQYLETLSPGIKNSVSKMIMEFTAK